MGTGSNLQSTSTSNGATACSETVSPSNHGKANHNPPGQRRLSMFVLGLAGSGGMSAVAMFSPRDEWPAK